MSSIFSATTIRPIHVFSSAFSAFLSANILCPRFWRSCNPGPTLRASITDGSVTNMGVSGECFYEPDIKSKYSSWQVIALDKSMLYLVSLNSPITLFSQLEKRSSQTLGLCWMVHSIYWRPKPAHAFVQGLTPEGEGWQKNMQYHPSCKYLVECPPHT